jgi:hypothetical protein
MAPKIRRNIAAHEPEQPLAGLTESIQDSEMMLQVWAGTLRRKTEALRKLKEEGMTVLGADVSEPKRRRRSRLSD